MHTLTHDTQLSSPPNRPMIFHALGLGETQGGSRLDALLRELPPARHYARGDHLFRASDRGDTLYLVQRGSVQLTTLSPNGEEQVIGFEYEGDLIGFEALAGAGYACSAIALEPTEARAISRAMLERMATAMPELRDSLLRLAARRIIGLERQALWLGRMTAAERLASFLLDLLERTGAGSDEIRLSMTRYAIGCHLGLALETVSRLMQQFQTSGLLKLEGRRVRISRPERLRALVGEPARTPGLVTGAVGHA